MSTKAFLKRYSFTLVFLVLFLSWMWLRPQEPAQIYELQGNTMGTSYSILLPGFPEGVSDNELAEGIRSRLRRIDRDLMSTYAPDSELSRFNRSEPGEWFAVSPELAYVVNRAIEIGELTEGYFDVTVGPLVDRWGFGPRVAENAGRARMPDESEIRALQEQIGYQHLEVSLEPPGLRKSQQVKVDLSGIAKGFGVDVIAEYFDELGLGSYFIEIGGELRIRGAKPDGSSWVPAIESPEAGMDSRIHRVIYTHDESLAVAGSGDYRNYFEEGGQRYSHEIDPFTGRPITHKLAAVYVIAGDAVTADALATAFMIMGGQPALALAEQQGVAAYFISKAPQGFDTMYSSRFGRYLEESP